MDKTFTLTISPDYVKNWTEQDAISEFIQNWIDQRNQEPEAGSAIKPKSTLDLLMASFRGNTNLFFKAPDRET